MKYLVLLLVICANMAMAREKHVEMGAHLFQSQEQSYLGITLKNDKEWHTYWKNPGDAGLPVKFEFFVGEHPYEMQALEWPVPKRYIEAGNILAYGYSDQYTFFYPLKEHMVNLMNQALSIKGTWLVCKDICLPGQGELKLKFNDKNAITQNSSTLKVSPQILEKDFTKIPSTQKMPELFSLFLTRIKGEAKLRLHYSYNTFPFGQYNSLKNLVTPFLTPPLGFRQEKLFYNDQDQSFHGYLEIDWDGEFSDPPQDLPADGKFNTPLELHLLLQTPSGVIKTQSTLSNLSPETQTLTNFYSRLTPVEQMNTQTSQSSESFWYYLLFGFIGGIILNLMPCVLPVISLKLFGLLGMREESDKRILKHNLAYTLGILLSFVVLAFVVLALKSSGESVGWGFQLQSPSFIFIMLVVLLIMTLNFFGLFEFRTPGGRVLGSKQFRKSFWGDVLTGVIAVVLSTPCSAPFLGTALTFAFTTTSFNIFAIFFSIGIGLAFPFILTGFFPGLISFLPKPGAWMEKLKYFLGLTLLLTFIWLYDVFQHLVDLELYGLYINTIFLFIFFAFYGARKIYQKKALKIIFYLLPIVMIIHIASLGIFQTANVQSSSKAVAANNLQWQSWSKEKMEQIKDQIVFIDFTAKWCLTCKVNKKLVLQTKGFKELVKKYKIKLMVADWTKRDEYITAFLTKNGKISVPAYFVWKNNRLLDLGEVLTLSEVEEKIKTF